MHGCWSDPPLILRTPFGGNETTALLSLFRHSSSSTTECSSRGRLRIGAAWSALLLGGPAAWGAEVDSVLAIGLVGRPVRFLRVPLDTRGVFLCGGGSWPAGLDGLRSIFRPLAALRTPVGRIGAALVGHCFYAERLLGIQWSTGHSRVDWWDGHFRVSWSPFRVPQSSRQWCRLAAVAGQWTELEVTLIQSSRWPQSL